MLDSLHIKYMKFDKICWNSNEVHFNKFAFLYYCITTVLFNTSLFFSENDITLQQSNKTTQRDMLL